MAELCSRELQATRLEAQARVLQFRAAAMRQPSMPDDGWSGAVIARLEAESSLASLRAAQVRGLAGSSLAHRAAASDAC